MDTFLVQGNTSTVRRIILVFLSVHGRQEEEDFLAVRRQARNDIFQAYHSLRFLHVERRNDQHHHSIVILSPCISLPFLTLCFFLLVPFYLSVFLYLIISFQYVSFFLLIPFLYLTVYLIISISMFACLYISTLSMPLCISPFSISMFACFLLTPFYISVYTVYVSPNYLSTYYMYLLQYLRYFIYLCFSVSYTSITFIFYLSISNKFQLNFIFLFALIYLPPQV